MSPPPGAEELPTTDSGQASPDPKTCPELKTELPTREQEKEIARQNLDTASGQEGRADSNPGDAAASASAVPGEELFVPDWEDPNVQTECAAASNDRESGDQTGKRDGLGPDEEDATASGQVRGESHGSTDETIYMLSLIHI